MNTKETGFPILIPGASDRLRWLQRCPKAPPPAPGQRYIRFRNRIFLRGPASKVAAKEFINLAATASTAILYPTGLPSERRLNRLSEYQITVSEDRGSTFTSERIRTGEGRIWATA